MSGRGKMSATTRRYLAMGSTGFAVAVTLLMVLAPASAGLLKPAYKGTSSSPNYYDSWSGCATGTLGASGWNATTGNITASDAATSKTCAGVTGPVNSYSSGYFDSGIAVGIPFKVTTNGNHSVATKLVFNLASTLAKTVGGCPKKNIAFHQPPQTSASAFCESGNEVSVYANAYVVDTSNQSWYYYNSSYFDAYNYSFWENYTSCSNFGTPSCSNTTTGYGYTSSYGYNEVGAAKFNLHGFTTVTMWTNGTHMVAGHVYMVILSVSDGASAYTYSVNLLTHWTATASATINMATGGHRALVASVTIV